MSPIMLLTNLSFDYCSSFLQEAYKKLEEAKGSGNASMGKQRSTEKCVSQLLKAVEELNFQAFEQEYHLSERIISVSTPETAFCMQK